MRNMKIKLLSFGLWSLVLVIGAGGLLQSCNKYEGGPGISFRSKKARLVHKEDVWNTEWYNPYGLYDSEGKPSTDNLSHADDGYMTVDFEGDGISDALQFRGYSLVAACKGGKSDLQFFKDGTCKTWFYSPIGTTNPTDWKGWDTDAVGNLVSLVEFNGRWDFEDNKEVLHIKWDILPTGSDWSDPDVVGDPPGATMDWHCDIHKLTFKEVWLEFNWFTDSFLLELDQLPTP